MTQGVPTKVIAAACGLGAFAVAVIAGLSADNPADTILMRAIVALVVCNLLGFVVGMVMEHVFSDAIRRYRRKVEPPPSDELLV